MRSQPLFGYVTRGPPRGTVQFSSATYSGDEGDLVTVTVTRAGGSEGIGTVHYATSDGTAIEGIDYTAASGTLTWGAGDAASKTFQVQLLSDLVMDPDETINLTLSEAVGVSLGDPTEAVLTIGEGTAVFAFAESAENVSPGANSVLVTRAGGTGVATVEVYDSSTFGSPDTAASGTDYTVTPEVLTWADGDYADKTFDFSTAALYMATASDFDGTTYGETANVQIGIPEGPKGTFSCWFKVEGGNTSDRRFITGCSLTSEGGGSSFQVRLQNATNCLEVFACNSNGSTLFLIASVQSFLAGEGWHHVAATWNLSATPTFSMYIDGVVAPVNVGSALIPGNISYQHAPGGNNTWQWAANAQIPRRIWNGCLSQGFFHDDSIDLAANITKFRGLDGSPALGSTGTGPFGGTPRIYFPSGDPGNNVGSVGNIFDTTGTITACVSSPSDGIAPRFFHLGLQTPVGGIVGSPANEQITIVP